MVIYDRSVQLPDFLVNVGYVQEPPKTTVSVGHSEDTFPKKTVFRDVFPGVKVRRVIHIAQVSAEKGQV